MSFALPRRLVALIAAASLAAVPLGPVMGQVDPSGDPLPITVEAKPDGGWVGTAIELSGRTLGTEGMDTVTLAVTLPTEKDQKSKPKILTATVDADGYYTATFEDTSNEGIYSVLATAPDGRGQASHEFRIFHAAQLVEEADVLLEALEVAGEHADNASTKLNDLPPSPAKDEAKQELEEITTALDQLRREAVEAKTALATLVRYSAADPEIAEAMRGPRDQLITALRDARKHTEQSAVELARLRQLTAICDNLEVVIEGLKLTSFMLSFAVGKLLDVAVNFGKELLGVVTERVATAAGAPGLLSFGASEVSKNIDLIVQRKPPDSLVGLINDVLGKAAEQWMSVYCEVFTGPVNGKMSAQFYENGQMWWSYEMSLTARITVHYPKDATGSSIPVKGRIEGYGHSFELWENALTVLYPGLMSSAVQKKQIIPPIELGVGGAAEGVNYAEGSVVGLGLPNSFFIAVEGLAEENQITITLGPARSDMSPTARVVAIILSPLSLLPAVTAYELPYKDARFVFERASGGADMVIPITTQNKVMRGKQEFYNQRGNASAEGTYSISIELCNPDCSGPPSGGGDGAPKL